MAIVVDEYGATQGVVTLADIIEAVAGTLPEAGTELELGARQAQRRLVARRRQLSGSTSSRIGSASSGLRGSGTFDTVAGYALFRLGRLPVVGDAFTDRTGHYEIVDMDGRRIDKLLYRPRIEEDG